jgi:hypothetical protein
MFVNQSIIGENERTNTSGIFLNKDNMHYHHHHHHHHTACKVLGLMACSGLVTIQKVF